MEDDDDDNDNNDKKNITSIILKMRKDENYAKNSCTNHEPPSGAERAD